MIRLCSQCNTELNGANCAKKDARRFRKICRACYRHKRSAYRDVKKEEQKEHLKALIDQQILKIDFESLIEKKKPQLAIPNVKYSEEEEHRVFIKAILWLKDKLKRIKNGL